MEPLLSVPFNLTDTEAVLRDYEAHQREHGSSYWAVVERATDAIIGDAGTTRGVELVYQSCSARDDAAFGPLGVDELTTVPRPENMPSVAVLAMLGYPNELHDHSGVLTN